MDKITKKQADGFLSEFHIQGIGQGSQRFGVFDGGDNSLLAVMVFKLNNSGTMSLVRYASKNSCSGHFAILLEYITLALPIKKVVAFSDNCISDDVLYKGNGFLLDGEVRPDYRYVVGANRKHKSEFSLKRFRDDSNLLWDESLSKKELVELNNLNRIWDAGKSRWVKFY